MPSRSLNSSNNFYRSSGGCFSLSWAGFEFDKISDRAANLFVFSCRRAGRLSSPACGTTCDRYWCIAVMETADFAAPAASSGECAVSPRQFVCFAPYSQRFGRKYWYIQVATTKYRVLAVEGRWWRSFSPLLCNRLWSADCALRGRNREVGDAMERRTWLQALHS